MHSSKDLLYDEIEEDYLSKTFVNDNSPHSVCSKCSGHPDKGAEYVCGSCDKGEFKRKSEVLGTKEEEVADAETIKKIQEIRFMAARQDAEYRRQMKEEMKEALNDFHRKVNSRKISPSKEQSEASIKKRCIPTLEDNENYENYERYTGSEEYEKSEQQRVRLEHKIDRIQEELSEDAPYRYEKARKQEEENLLQDYIQRVQDAQLEEYTKKINKLKEESKRKIERMLEQKKYIEVRKYKYGLLEREEVKAL